MSIAFWQIAIVIITVAVVWFLLAKKYRTKEVEQYNKKHNKNFKTWEELERYREIKTEKSIEEEKKFLKEIEKKRIEEKLVETDDEVVDSLTGKIARLKKLYKNGTLTKAEFEKAKNNLLK